MNIPMGGVGGEGLSPVPGVGEGFPLGPGDFLAFVPGRRSGEEPGAPGALIMFGGPGPLGEPVFAKALKLVADIRAAQMDVLTARQASCPTEPGTAGVTGVIVLGLSKVF